MNRNDLRRLARIRLQEARVLLEARLFSGAYYLCDYAIECALKARIAKETRQSEFPDLDRVKASYTHNRTNLLKLGGLEALLQTEVVSDTDFGLNWTIAKDWSEKVRYLEHSEKKARELYRAVTDRQHGVMRWIRQHW